MNRTLISFALLAFAHASIAQGTAGNEAAQSGAPSGAQHTGGAPAAESAAQSAAPAVAQPATQPAAGAPAPGLADAPTTAPAAPATQAAGTAPGAAPVATSRKSGNWTFVGRGSNGTVWVDESSIQPTASGRQAWFLSDMDKPLANGLRSIKQHSEFDCTNRRERMVQGLGYRTPMGEGSEGGSMKPPSPGFTQVAPDSSSAVLLNVACDYSLPGRKWVQFGGGDSAFFFEPETVVLGDKGYRMWIMSNHPTKPQPGQSSQMLFDVDCMRGRLQVIRAAAFSGEMGRGITEFRSDKATPWIDPAPRTGHAHMVSWMCANFRPAAAPARR